EPVPGHFSNTQVAVDDTRKLVYVAYPSGTPDGKWNLRLAVSGDDGESWRRIVVNDDPPCATHMTPQLVVDPISGTVHVTWLDNRDGRGFVAYATCPAGAASCSKNERISESFTRFSFARHLPHWLGEYGALVLDRERRVVHAVWAQTVQERGEDVSR